MKSYYVYILAGRRDGAIYVGVTSDLVKRVYEHRGKFVQGFTSQYNITQLVWFEVHDDPIAAITREKELKEMAAGLENRADREGQSGVAGSVRGDLLLMSFRGRSSAGCD